MKRLFVAVNLADEVKEELEEVKQSVINLFDMGVGEQVAKWVKKENMHITMQFIGEIKDEQLPEIIKQVEEKVASWRKFKVRIGRVSYGAMDRGVPRLIWAEIDGNKDLECVANILDNKNFKPHITLGRVRQWVWRKIDPEEQPNIEQDLDIKFEVSNIDIMESKLSRTGPVYSIFKKIDLL